MRRILFVSALALLGMTTPTRAGFLSCCLEHGVHCMVPEHYCPDCSEPCCHRHSLALGGQDHCCKLLDELHSGCCCDRIKAAKKLGCRLHADYCACPEILPALVHALQCDTCYEVRWHAAWAIAYQGARTRLGVLALYLAAKLDRHYMVRDAATDALDVLLVCRRDCFKDLFDAADALAAKIRPMYDPTNGSCVNIYEQCCALAGVTPGEVSGQVVLPAPAGAAVGAAPVPQGVTVEPLTVPPTPAKPMPKPR